ncbi:MAG: hypothetical protein U0325_09285 [Polyangiales bacterium]
MRSRPSISLFLSPRAVTPGQRLVARVRLDVRTETPCDGVIVTLLGRERRYRNTTSTGKTTVQHYHRRDVISQGLQISPGTLRPGVLEQEFPFDIPADAPPTYRSALARIEYSLDVRVDIPWWPDAHEVYDLIVAPPPRLGLRGAPRAVTNVQGDRRGEGLAMELSLAEDVTQPGGALRGALAITGMQGTSLRRVEVACVAVESPLVYSSAGPQEVDRREWVIRQGTPGEGEAMRFDLAVPAEMPGAFVSPFVQVTHHLEAKAVVAWGRDVSVHIPLLVAPGAGDVQSAAVPMVGRARNLAVWQQAVQQVSIPGASLVRFEPEQGQVVFSVHGLKVIAREETRDDSPCLVAEVSLPGLGIGLRVAERRWTDLGARLPEVDGFFQQRFTVKAREAGQAVAVLDASLRESLARFDEAAMDDDHAVLTRAGGVFQLEGLQRFLLDVQVVAATLAAAVVRVPPPAALADRARAFADFATARGATLRVGDLTLHGWSVKGIVLRTALRWEKGAIVGMALGVSLPEGADASRWEAALREGLSLPAEVREGVAWVGWEVPQDPASLMPIAERVAEVALSLQRSGGDAGPYRR